MKKLTLMILCGFMPFTSSAITGEVAAYDLICLPESEMDSSDAQFLSTKNGRGDFKERKFHRFFFYAPEEAILQLAAESAEEVKKLDDADPVTRMTRKALLEANRDKGWDENTTFLLAATSSWIQVVASETFEKVRHLCQNLVLQEAHPWKTKCFNDVGFLYQFSISEQFCAEHFQVDDGPQKLMDLIHSEFEL